jgi:hypothetical protein
MQAPPSKESVRLTREEILVKVAKRPRRPMEGLLPEDWSFLDLFIKKQRQRK